MTSAPQLFEAVPVSKQLATIKDDTADLLSPAASEELKHDDPQTFGADEWVQFAEASRRTSIPNGDHYALQLNLPGRRMYEELPENSLNDHCMGAVERAPDWLRADLINNLNRIGGEWAEFFQEFAADVILDADDHIVDEVAFTIAHTASNLLEDGVMDLNLFIDNSETIYESDEYLDYVRIVEHGDFEEGDYWTTLEYKIKDGDDTTDVEIDREIYYWYVVMPRLSDEMPLYINPANGRQDDPPNGVFWRDFLLNHPDDEYESLRDRLEGVGVMWSNLRNNQTAENGALGLVSSWVGSIMEFDSGNERPIQPVRIYALHMGRCGEHSDMRAAAGRAALIPTLCTTAFCDDHTWNEFWGGDRWVHWDGAIDNPLMYENGWGKVFPVVVNWRSDSYLWGATEKYSEDISDLTVTVLDRDDQPVDGAEVRLASEYLYGGNSWCAWGYTNCDGQVSFKVGNNRNIYGRAESRCGRYPDGGVMEIVGREDNEGGQEFEWTALMWGAVPSISPGEADAVDNPTDHFRLNVDYELVKESAVGSINWRTNRAEFISGVGTGEIDFMICDARNYRLYIEGEDFEAYINETLHQSGELGLPLPTDGVWYAIFSNDNCLSNYIELDINATLSYDDAEVSISEQPAASVEYRLLQNYPNPFNAQTRLTYSLPVSSQLSLNVYSSSGQLVTTLFDGVQTAGNHSLLWNAEDVSAGIYFVRMESNRFSDTRKVVLVK